MDLVRVEKRTLTFPAASSDASAPVSDTLHIANVADVDVAFKVKTTNQARYIVRPNVGVIARGASLSILIGMQPSPDMPVLGPSKDKFLLRVAEAPGISETGFPKDYWVDRESDPDVVSIKFRVEFVAEGQEALVDDIDDIVPVDAPPPHATNAPASAPQPRDLPPAVTSDSPFAPSASVVVPSAAQDHGRSDGTAFRSGRAASTAASGQRFNSALGPVPMKAADMPDAEELLQERNYELALRRVRELQATLDTKNLELARLRADLAETRAQSEKVLKEAPKTPLSANKIVSDPFGGVSVAGFGVMLVLFFILVNVVLRIV